MAEQIKIFELNIDVDAALKAQSDLRKEVKGLKETLDSLKKSGDTTSETYVKLDATYKNLNRQYNASQTQLGKLLKLQGKEIKTVEQGRNALTILNKEWAKATKLYGQNSKEADALAKQHKELKDRVNELQKSIGDTSGNIGNYSADIVDAVGKTTLFGRAIGIVNDIQKIAIPLWKAVRLEISLIKSDYAKAIAATKGYSKAQKAAAIANALTAASLRILKIALISTGIGAIIVLIGSLVAWFSKTQKGIDFVNKALAGLGAFFDVITDRAAKLGGALLKLIKLDFSGFWNDAKDAMSGIGDEMLREISLAIKLEQALQNLTKQETLLDFRRAAANTRIKELNKLVEDTTKATEDRIAAAKEVEQLETEIAAQELANANQALALAQGKLESDEESIKLLEQLKAGTIEYDEVLKRLGLSESTQEDLEKFLEAFQKAEEAQQRSFEVRTTNQNKLNTLLNEEKRLREKAAKERAAVAKKAIDDAIKESKTRLKLFIEENKGQAKSLAEGVKFQEQLRDKRLAVLQEEIDAGKKTQTEALLEELKIKNEFLEKQTELTIQFADEELRVFKFYNQSRLEEGQLLTEALIEQEKQRLIAIADQEKIFQEKRLDQGLISEIEYQEAIKAINDEYRIAKDELELELKQQKEEAELIDLENRRILEEGNLEYDLETQLAYLERQKQLELEQAEAKGADLQLINEKYAAAEIMIKEKVREAKLGIASSFFHNVSSLLGQESDLGKAVAIGAVIAEKASSVSRIVANTGIANTKAIAASPLTFGQPWVTINTISAGASIAASVAAGAKAIGEIKKAEKGALFEIGGKRHAQGGTMFYGEDGTRFEAEQGELIGVMNRNAAALFMEFNNQNNTGNGAIPNYFADGGIVQRSVQGGIPSRQPSINISPIDYALLSETLAESFKQLPAPITDVNDIIGEVNNRNQVVDGANI